MKVDQSSCLLICIPYLDGKCTTATCKYAHPAIKQLYVWQYLKDGEWKYFNTTNNEGIETAFCKSSCSDWKSSLTIRNRLQTATLCFQAMKITCSSDSIPVRRLSTASSLVCPSVHATRWRWYPLEKKGHKTMNGFVTQNFEETFLSGHTTCEVKIDNDSISLDIKNMTVTYARSGQTWPVLRRPQKNMYKRCSGASTAGSGTSTVCSGTSTATSLTYVGNSSASSDSIPKRIDVTMGSEAKSKCAQTEANMKKQDLQPYVCPEHLKGVCSHPVGRCELHHCSQFYQWQIHTDMDTQCDALVCHVKERGSVLWRHFKTGVNSKLEELYINPNVDSCYVYSHRVSFEVMNITIGSDTRTIRRLTTPYTAAQNPSSAPDGSTDTAAVQHHTRWEWYYKNKQGKWLPYTSKNAAITSARIENRYQLKKKRGQIDIIGEHQDIVINFDKMKEFCLESNALTDVRRRPHSRTNTSLAVGAPIVRLQLVDWVCGAFLNGTCELQDCNRYHSLTNFQWLYRDPDCKNWKRFDKQKNLAIEQAYTDPANDSVHVYSSMSKPFGLVSFPSMNIDLDGSPPRTVSVKRLCVEPGSARSISPDERNNLETIWLWYRLEEDGWQLYTVETIVDILESGFRNRGCDVFNCCISGQSYKVNFKNMTLMHQATGCFHFIKRRPKTCLHDVDSNHIVNMLSGVYAGRYYEHYTLSNVSPNDEAYDTISRRFYATMRNIQPTAIVHTAPPVAGLYNAHITSIQKIRNPYLWDNYCRKKAHMQVSNGGHPPVELQLFHGTPSYLSSAICKQGFDWRLAGLSRGTRHGKGSYFTKHAFFAHGFAQGSGELLVAKVLVGKYTLGHPEIVRPPPVDITRPNDRLYDSCVNRMVDPHIFVIFDQNQAYPEYIIHYSIH